MFASKYRCFCISDHNQSYNMNGNRQNHCYRFYFRLTITASCPMRLHYFPMDRQLCTIEIESCKSQIYVLLNRNTFIIIDKKLNLSDVNELSLIPNDL